jgi:tetratricopeptide (TPR) repeat protein
MKRCFTVLTAILLLTLTSCDKRVSEIKEINAMSTEVDSMIRSVPVLTVEQKVKTEALIAEYLEFATNYPKDTLSAKYLIDAALLYIVLPDYNKSLHVIDQLVKQFPKSNYAPQGLAIAARVSEDNLRNFESAKGYLQQIQTNYSESPYAVNIDLQIEYLGDTQGLLEAIMDRTGQSMPGEVAPDSVDAVK